MSTLPTLPGVIGVEVLAGDGAAGDEGLVGGGVAGPAATAGGDAGAGGACGGVELVAGTTGFGELLAVVLPLLSGVVASPAPVGPGDALPFVAPV